MNAIVFILVFMMVVGSIAFALIFITNGGRRGWKVAKAIAKRIRTEGTYKKEFSYLTVRFPDGGEISFRPNGQLYVNDIPFGFIVERAFHQTFIVANRERKRKQEWKRLEKLAGMEE